MNFLPSPVIAAPSLNPGRLDRRITLRSPVETRSSSGDVLKGWADLATVWAQRLPARGREFAAAAGRWAETTDVFRIRHRSDLDARCRVVLGVTVYDLTAPPMEIGRTEYLDLFCRSLAESASVATAQAFTVALAEGDTTKAVTFPTAFASAPRGLKVQLLVPSGGFNFGADPDSSTLTASGFTCLLGAAVPAAGYQLSIIAIR